ncbi:MAG: 1,4-dihydroxy-6-naphthoate synthase [Kiritimatiellia bacterium]|jgi:1,4-dihydroxy-6-naphthoate synthase|nr:1,4-dihydroxy-6-naphthoate synthase [Kiritimatiellia bacterium]MDP6810709.1 1,4-dihydroxy-6-naphthoate synthase [Kiritimatiellia bacterium]MDP7023304.1 1,4-dihydroxy-6-naphthoate synthase [Kiritimatiellia bacterium]
MIPLTLAYSPCPNDTFIFGAIATGQIDTHDLSFDIRLHDVQTLNERLLESTFDVSKVSFHAYLRARNTYNLLDAGAALGFGCGPLVVARDAEALRQPGHIRIAVPGELTTANLLLHLWNPAIETRLFCRYDEVMAMVADGRADAGVIIHESRFAYAQAGLVCIADLGAWWEHETGHPIPLGCIVARRAAALPSADTLESLIRESIAYAQSHPETTTPYIAAHARELSPDVVAQHVAMFVNRFSLSLGEEGRAAIDRLATMAQGKVPGL